MGSVMGSIGGRFGNSALVEFASLATYGSGSGWVGNGMHSHEGNY
jgi:hypothetical protein